MMKKLAVNETITFNDQTLDTTFENSFKSVTNRGKKDLNFS